MPRFSESEKEKVKEKLMQEGERLFTAFGIKKVTVDDLVQATGIAKGSFYVFYQNKEHLYLDIANNLQQKMWRDMDGFLNERWNMPPKELTKQVVLWMFERLERYPLLVQAVGETADYLYRKLPKEIYEAHMLDDIHSLAKLQEYGISFKCDMKLTAKILQVIAMALLNLQQVDAEERAAVTNIILDGVVNEIVGD